MAKLEADRCILQLFFTNAPLRSHGCRAILQWLVCFCLYTDVAGFEYLWRRNFLCVLSYCYAKKIYIPRLLELRLRSGTGTFDNCNFDRYFTTTTISTSLVFYLYMYLRKIKKWLNEWMTVWIRIQNTDVATENRVSHGHKGANKIVANTKYTIRTFNVVYQISDITSLLFLPSHASDFCIYKAALFRMWAC
jgi:hypothetical protein